MKIKKIFIENYRAIKSLEVDLKYSINPIIGINEAGKTSILKAILAFDKSRDSYNKGEHLDPQNKYHTKDTTDCMIKASIFLDAEEIKKLIKFLNIKTDTDDFVIIEKFYEKDEFLLIRKLSKDKSPQYKHGKYLYSNENLSDNVSNRVRDFLVMHLPILLYFDDFTDRVPEQISFPNDYKDTGKLSPKAIEKDWQEIIQEIFRRADTEGIESEDTSKPLQNFLTIKDVDRKDNILSDIEYTLNKEIIEEWQKIKKRGDTSFADDSMKLELQMSFSEGNKFTFKVKDSASNNKKRLFNINERSKGFQWFFNYMIKLKFNPRYRVKQENSIFLLDEPGSYLHSSAQEELLKELKEVSKENTIIYCTHSQFLLNPEHIKLGNIKIAEKKEDSIVLHDYGSYRTDNKGGALTPIYQALQLNFSFDFRGKIVVTEGVTDFYFFNMLKKYTDKIDENITFIPGTGAGSLSTLLSLSIAFSEKFLVILDKDDDGTEAKKKYIGSFGDKVSEFIYMYKNDKKKCELEDIFSPLDGKKLKTITSADNIKKALPILYYDNIEEEKRKFIEGLDNTTLKNLKGTFEAISKLSQNSSI